jgi:hypothetical protein
MQEDKKESKATNSKPWEASADVDFNCFRCGMSEKVHYLGKEPPFAKKYVTFVEPTYVMMDPFVPRLAGRANFLILGGHCGGAGESSNGCCGRSVCVECSVFYGRRYCLDCATKHAREFPEEVKAKISKKVASSAS